ncbi:type IV secretory system conjugative DNA transfer family protein [Subtercola sp. RTI3]|uniref:type IV secretory system conjugative DNA transfer family protein n=1 Tax=Subtercola sp. RTI3 TaxID=3048639 RepID=UPI002B22C035|nr:type IV secretory system conjugative DNA transfer family protein [Subtercola sp. RTI3]MEA9986268.1 type IV secretory system conjugative DNA transfer family protein [Subtercola sp. RTI3]
MLVPRNEAEYIANQLRTQIPGLTVAEDTERPTLEWNYVLEVGMARPSRTLRITNAKDLSASLLASVQALGEDETILTQWIVSPAKHEQLPSKQSAPVTHDFHVTQALTGKQLAQNDEIEDRRTKLSEHNFIALGRIATVAKDEKTAKNLAYRITKSLAGAHSHSNRFVTRGGDKKKGSDQVNNAETPLTFTAQFGISELKAILAWPIGRPFVTGLPAGSTRHLFATEDVPRVGRILGDSNYPGHERAIALDYTYAIQHMYVGGKTGTGKTVLMANSFAQDVANGYGAIVVDASNSVSSESMFSRALSYVPANRMDDVIIVNVAEDLTNPVGINILDQGNPRIVADQIKDLFASMYQDTSGVWTKQLLFHGLYTLAERKGMTFVDLMPLLNPQTKTEIAWSDDLIRSVKDKELRNFWQRWQNFSQGERDRYTQPLLNRIWQLVSRPEARNIIGQSVSSFQMKEVLADNKILLISLSGLPSDTAGILGTLLVNAIWTAAQTMTPEKPNFLYLDEFQVMTKLPLGLDDMLNRARKHKLGVVMGTQYLEDITPELRNAVINNARSRVIFQSSSKEARTWKSEFRDLDENDFMRIRQYEAVAQLATSSGVMAPVTMKTRPPQPSSGFAGRARQLSQERYGRAIGDVEAEMVSRRAPESGAGKRPPIGMKEWDDVG